MKIITLNEKIKLVFNVLVILLIMRRFKILICILFYSIATIFIKNHKNEIKLCYLVRKMRRVKRK